MCWIGTATDTMVSPSSSIRTADCGLALKRGGDFRHCLAVDQPRVFGCGGAAASGIDCANRRSRDRSNPAPLGRSGRSERTTAPRARDERELSRSRPSRS